MDPHPSVNHYKYRRCRCPDCVDCYNDYKRGYDARRRANNGYPLKPTGEMPSLMTRLRREIGYVLPWRR